MGAANHWTPFWFTCSNICHYKPVIFSNKLFRFLNTKNRMFKSKTGHLFVVELNHSLEPRPGGQGVRVQPRRPQQLHSSGKSQHLWR